MHDCLKTSIYDNRIDNGDSIMTLLVVANGRELDKEATQQLITKYINILVFLIFPMTKLIQIISFRHLAPL